MISRRRGGGRSASYLAAVAALVGLTLLEVVRGAYPAVPRSFHRNTNQMESLRPLPIVRNVIFATAASSPGSAQPPAPTTTPSRVYHVTDYGADPTGKSDATDAIMKVVSAAFQPPSSDRFLMSGITDLGGAEVHLDGGSYLISSPIRLPSSSGGNFKIHGGSLHASDDFPTDRYLIELRSTSSTGLDYEYITLTDLMLDSNFRGGGIAVINSLRTTIHNCYITHFTSDGILVKSGHETYISNSYLGQHITAGGDSGEKNFTGVGINLAGNDNAVTDVVIFSAAIGILVSGQANTISGVHCYNKATGFGGTGIYLKLPGLTQTRIVNCYLDYTGIVAEDPAQLHISGSFFLGDAYIVLKSVKGVIRGVNIVNNMFSGGDKGVDIVQLDQSGGQFTTIEQVIVDKNNVRGMRLKSTVGIGSVQGNGSSWTVDFSPVLLFPDRIEYVQYTLLIAGVQFTNHALRNVSENRVVVVSESPVTATVHALVDQSVGTIG